MQPSFLLRAFTGLSLLTLLNGVFTPNAWAGRYVLNQTPQTIQGYFGRYQTRQTTKDGVIYTYAPARFRRLFPQFRKSNFSITFVNDCANAFGFASLTRTLCERAKYITLNFNGSFEQFPDTDNYGQAEASRFFNYIFGYQPPIWKELSDKFTGNETIYDYEYCLGDGVATSFQRYGYKQFTDTASLYYDSRCEPY